MIDNSVIDISIQLIAKIFGNNWVDGTAIGKNGTIVFLLLDTLNKILLSLVVLSFIWTMAIASANTANEGKPLGQKFSTMWVPIRAMLGVSFLVPIFGGLSMFQVFLLQAVEFSIDTANVGNKQVHEFFFKETPTGDMYLNGIPGLEQSSRDLGKKVLEAALVQQYYLQKEKVDLNDDGYFTVEGEGSIVNIKMGAPKTFSLRGLAGDLNTMYVKLDCNQVTDTVCKGRTNAVTTFISSIIPVAASSVAGTLPEPGGDGFEKNVADYKAALAKYQEEMTAVAYELAGQDKGRQENQKKIMDSNAQEKGWAVLGGYYWVASNNSKRTMEIAGLVPEVNEPRMGWLTDFSFANGDAKSIKERADAIDKAVYLELDVEKKSGLLGIFNVADSSSDAIARWALGLDKGYDMLTGLQNAGHSLLTGCAIIFSAASTVVDVTGSDGGSSFLGGAMKKGAGVAGKVVGGVAGQMAGNFVANFAKIGFIGLVLLYPFAFYLAMGLPAIPLIYWTLGVLNWLISVITLIIGATIWAAAISLPDGDGVAGNHGREGFMLLANCLLRPFLMVFGFVIAYLLIRCSGFLVYEILATGLNAMSGEYSRGFAVFIGNLAVYATIATILIVKIFGVMITLPDIILTFVGKHLQGSGEHGDVEKTSGGLKHVGQGGGQVVGKLTAKPG